MDDLTKQIEEIETLTAIYGDELQTEDEENRSYSIKISDNRNKNLYVKLYFKLPEDYPTMSPPTFEISAPHLKKNQKEQLCHALEDVYLSNIGDTVIFQFIEKIREEFSSSLELEDQLKDLTISKPIPIENDNEDRLFECPEIIHGETMIDRKSSFQGHTATVFSVEQVRQVINKLKENKKIEHATHNISAYRIYNESNNSFIHDCDDDGETQAGSRLLHLLEIMNVKNIVVIVSRWYGGIHLGPDRFRHINNAARQVLTAANLIPITKK
ncbi:protein IMPACT-like [Copidosoma floridanum]|uniref:protein IMPACT-like n=1 Tax=Copidosoma floridanum TaxID=29053 RepID=UPI0006C9B79C|nr:protein IMPACT-like [Copidosoma floridanum]